MSGPARVFRAAAEKRPLIGKSLGVWDEVLALNALSFLCSGLAHLMI